MFSRFMCKSSGQTLSAKAVYALITSNYSAIMASMARLNEQEWFDSNHSADEIKRATLNGKIADAYQTWLVDYVSHGALKIMLLQFL